MKKDYISTNSVGEMKICDVDCNFLAKEYNTPLYVMNEEKIRDNCRKFISSIKKYYKGNSLIFYASKALSNKAIYKVLKEEGMGIDVVSGGELYTAIKSDFPMDRVCFHGNNKSIEEIDMAIKNDVRMIVICNKEELHFVDEISKKYNKKTNIMLRVRPNIKANTHEHIMTAHEDCKFGFSILNNEVVDVCKQAKTLENIELKGLHCHIGSKIQEIEPYYLLIEKLVNIYFILKDEHNIILNEINLGGGFGINYTDEDNSLKYEDIMKLISTKLMSCCKSKDIDLPFVYFEPGRSIVGNAGITLYEVGIIKEIKNIRKYISVDGGMADNPQFITYGTKFDVLSVNNPKCENKEMVTIAGKCCESGDIIAKDVWLPKVKRGDIIAICDTGAYNYSMSSNYNRLRKPAMVFVSGNNHRLVQKRETYEDIIRNDL